MSYLCHILGHYIGLVKSADGTPIWDATGEIANFTDYRTGDPAGHGACFGMYTSNSVYQWGDAPCSIRVTTLCEF